MKFEILGAISNTEVFRHRLCNPRERAAETGLWPRSLRKRKGIARVRLSDGSVHLAEVHWYEASGIGRKEFKIKRLL